MADSVYKVIELVGSSTDGWEQAARAAMDRASGTLRNIRVAEVDKLDVHIEDGQLVYRARLRISFKYEGD